MPSLDLAYHDGTRWVGPAAPAPVIPPTTDPTPTPGTWDARVRRPQTEAELPYPVYDIESLRQGTDTRISAIAARIPTAGGYLRLPRGEYPIKLAPDFTMPDSSGEYHDKLLGFIGEPNGQAGGASTLRVDPSPSNAYMLKLLRLGNQNVHTNGRNVAFMQDVTLIGAEKPYTGAASTPRSPYRPNATVYTGVMLYNTTKATLNRVKMRGFCYGAGNSPNNGETFTINNFRANDTLLVDSDIDGRDEAGVRVAASPFGGNAAGDATIYRSHLHDSAVSGLTGSFTGSADGSGTPQPGTLTVIDSRVGNNAQWYRSVSNTSRYGFTLGCNNEGVTGGLLMENVDVYHDLITAGGEVHGTWSDVSINTMFTSKDTSPVVIRDSFTRNRPTLIVQMEYEYAGQRNQQRTLPDVYRGSTKLTPYIYRGEPRWDLPGLDVTKQYILFWQSAPAGVTFPNL